MRRCRILIVEDEALIAMHLQASLEDDGHQIVGPATNLTDGLALAEQETFDLALVDLNLGRDTSVPIADVLMRRAVPFAFTSGFSDMTRLPDPMRLIPCIAKPYSPDELRALLSRLQSGSTD